MVFATVTRTVDHVDHALPQRDRLYVQVVVAQRDRTQDLGVGDQKSVFGGEFGDRLVVGQGDQCGLGGLMVAVRRGQPGLQELRAPRVPAHHQLDLGRRHRHLCRGLGLVTRENRRIDGQAFAHPVQAFLGAVVCGADEIDLAEQRIHLEHPVVAAGLLDLRHQRQQEILGRLLVGGEREVTGTLEVRGDRHRAIIESGGHAWHARRFRRWIAQLQLTLTVNGLVIDPAIGFEMSAPAASPVMV